MKNESDKCRVIDGLEYPPKISNNCNGTTVDIRGLQKRWVSKIECQLLGRQCELGGTCTVIAAKTIFGSGLKASA